MTLRKKLEYWLFVPAIMLAMMLVVKTCVPVQVAHAEGEYKGRPSTLTCFQEQREFHVLKVIDGELFKGAPVRVFIIDRNLDGGHDGMLIFTQLGNQFAPLPTYYILDLDYDGRPDKAWMDTAGNGDCRDMKQIMLSELLQDGGKES